MSNTNKTPRISELNSEIKRKAKSLELCAKYIGNHVYDEDARGIKSHIQMAVGSLSLLIKALDEKESLD